MPAETTPAANHAVRLKRAIGLWELVIIGIVIIQPIAPMGIYGVISNEARGHVVTTILIAMVAMLFTAFSYGKMARAYPSAGSAYTYVGQEIHPGLGYITGWAMVMDYILNPLICTVICSKLTQNILPWAPYWLLAIAFATAFTVIHFLLGIHHYGAAFFTRPFYNPATFNPHSIFRGTAIAVLTYIGFDAISTFSEEVENPRRNVMLATVLVCLITGLLSSVEVYAAQLVWGSAPFPVDKVESAFPLVSRQVGGFFLFQLVNFTILIANVGSGMGAQLGAARLLYGMGRSNGIPKKFFGFIDQKNRIPRNNVIFVGAIALVGAFFISYERGAELLNFGALIAFMGVNAAAFVRYFLRAEKKGWTAFLAPILGFVICFYIWRNLSKNAMLLGAFWMIAGIIYGAIKTRGFQASLVNFDIPPEEE
jgi:putrescine importer